MKHQRTMFPDNLTIEEIKAIYVKLICLKNNLCEICEAEKLCNNEIDYLTEEALPKLKAFIEKVKQCQL